MLDSLVEQLRTLSVEVVVELVSEVLDLDVGVLKVCLFFVCIYSVDVAPDVVAADC